MLQNTRRLNLAGNLTLAPYCEILLPRASFALLRLIIGSLSEDDRRDGKFYTRFLTERYPAYFRNVAWQKTGRGLNESLSVRLIRNLRSEGKRRTFELSPSVPGVWRFARRLRPQYQYFIDYYELLQSTGVREKLLREKLLTDEVLSGRARQVLTTPPTDPHIYTETIMALITLETHLRQVSGLPGLGNRWAARPESAGCRKARPGT